MNGADADQTANTVAVPEGVDAGLLVTFGGGIMMLYKLAINRVRYHYSC